MFLPTFFCRYLLERETPKSAERFMESGPVQRQLEPHNRKFSGASKKAFMNKTTRLGMAGESGTTINKEDSRRHN
jgi:hypothetical protein